MQLLLSRAGLVLNPGQVADLVLAWRQVAGLIASLPHDRPLADDMALVFRLPPPAPAVARPATGTPARKPASPKAKASAKSVPARKKVVAPKRATPKTAAPKAAGKRKAAAKPAARKSARRGR
ncbi:MAG: hypothetical protein WDN25_15980 [Acetobacteraceae bacterium]